MTMRAALLTVALVIHVAPACAADMPLRYLLDERAIRAVEATSPATIELFTDAGCTVGVFATTLPLGEVDLLVRVPLLSLRGVAKSPKAAELRHVLHGVPAVAPLYARIAAPGVVPIGGACQVQSIPAPPANTPVLIDATGTVLGPYAVSTDFSGRPVWIRSSGDLTYGVAVEPTMLSGTDSVLFFEAPDCSSLPLMSAEYYSLELMYGSVSHGATLYYPVGTPHQRTITARSYYAGTPSECAGGGVFAPPDHCCAPFAWSGPNAILIDTATTDLGSFVPPFHAELR